MTGLFRDPSIRLSADGLFFLLTIPGQDLDHTVRIPVTDDRYTPEGTLVIGGATALRNFLQTHADTTRQEDRRIGTRSQPTQAMIDAFLKAGGHVEDRVARESRKATERLEKLGVDVDALLNGIEVNL